MEKQFSKDDEIIVSKSRVSSIASQFPSKGFPYGIEAQATSGHELTSSHKKGIESKIPGLEAKMKQTEKGKQEFIVNIHGLWIPSVENSEDLFNEPSTSQQCLIDQQHRLGNIDTTVKRSQEYVDGSVNDDMKVSSTMAKQFPKDDKIMVSKSRVFSVASQFPSKGFPYGTEAQATSGHELTSSNKNGIESKIPGLEAKMKQTTKGKQEFILNIHGVWIPSVASSEDIKLSVEDITTLVPYAKTITSPTLSKPNISSSGPSVTYDHKTSSLEYGDAQIAIPSFSISTKKRLTIEEVVDLGDSQESTQTNNQVSINDDASMKGSSNVKEQFPKDDEILVSKSRLFSTASQFPSMPSKGDASEIVEDLSSSLLIMRELEQLVFKKHLDYENLSLLTDFLVKHPSVLLRGTSLSNRYKGYAYNCLSEVLKFLQTHSVLDVLGSSHSEFVELLQDARRFPFDKDWLDGVEKRSLFPGLQVSQAALQKVLDSKHILTQHVEDLKHQLASSEAVLESIIQQEAQILETRAALSDPIGY
ncbi:hypothetical protein QL285_013482 [Trifolium repens]|nr:hypothetical protein QL285_013482 [Trifolium repens]